MFLNVFLKIWTIVIISIIDEIDREVGLDLTRTESRLDEQEAKIWIIDYRDIVRIGVIDLVIKRNNPAARFKEQGRKVKEERHRRFDRDKFSKKYLDHLLSPLKISIEFIALSKLSKTFYIIR